MTLTNQWACLEWHTTTHTIFAVCSMRAMHSMHGMQIFCMHEISGTPTTTAKMPRHTA